jgi:hypothetical protein
MDSFHCRHGGTQGINRKSARSFGVIDLDIDDGKEDVVNKLNADQVHHFRENVVKRQSIEDRPSGNIEVIFLLRHVRYG